MWWPFSFLTWCTSPKYLMETLFVSVHIYFWCLSIVTLRKDIETRQSLLDILYSDYFVRISEHVQEVRKWYYLLILYRTERIYTLYRFLPFNWLMMSNNWRNICITSKRKHVVWYWHSQNDNECHNLATMSKQAANHLPLPQSSRPRPAERQTFQYILRTSHIAFTGWEKRARVSCLIRTLVVQSNHSLQDSFS